MIIMDIEGDQVEYTLVPLDLDMRRDNCLKRGLPEIPEEEVGQKITEFLTEMSKKYGTQFTYHADTRDDEGEVKMKKKDLLFSKSFLIFYFEQNDVIKTEKMIQKRCDRQMPYVSKTFWKTVVVAVASL